MPLFGKSVASRYGEAAASLGPSGAAEFADPITWAALRLARDEVRRKYLPAMSSLIDTEEAQHIWANEVFRLLNDGYLLGRIEAKSEGRTLRFSGIAEADPAYEAGEFALIAAQAISALTGSGKASGPPPSDILKLLKQFAADAGRLLLDNLTESSQVQETILRTQARLLGEANIRAVNLGRELAVLEDFYVNPKKRRDLLKIREEIEAEGLRHFDEVKNELQEAGVEAPSDWAAQMMREVYDRIRL